MTDINHAGRIVGQGLDPASGTRLTGAAGFRVHPEGAPASITQIEITYSMRGALDQLGPGPIIRVFVAELAAERRAQSRGSTPRRSRAIRTRAIARRQRAHQIGVAMVARVVAPIRGLTQCPTTAV